MKNKLNQWWISIVVGIIIVIMGVITLFAPEDTFITISKIIGACLIIIGIYQVIISVRNRSVRKWKWNLVVGIIDMILGVFLLLSPETTFKLLIYFVSVYVLFQSIYGIVHSINMKNSGSKLWSWLLVVCMLGIILSIVLFVRPMIVASFIGVLFSLGLIIYGLFRIIYALFLNTINKEINKYDEYEEIEEDDYEEIED